MSQAERRILKNADDRKIAAGGGVGAKPVAVGPGTDDQHDAIGARGGDPIEDMGEDRLPRDGEERFRRRVGVRLEPCAGSGRRDDGDQAHARRAFFSDSTPGSALGSIPFRRAR